MLPVQTLYCFASPHFRGGAPRLQARQLNMMQLNNKIQSNHGFIPMY
jgi:hypothetical protein